MGQIGANGWRLTHSVIVSELIVLGIESNRAHNFGIVQIPFQNLKRDIFKVIIKTILVSVLSLFHF